MISLIIYDPLTGETETEPQFTRHDRNVAIAAFISIIVIAVFLWSEMAW